MRNALYPVEHRLIADADRLRRILSLRSGISLFDSGERVSRPIQHRGQGRTIMWREPKTRAERRELAAAVMREFFPQIAEEGLMDCIEHLLASIHTEHQRFQAGPLRQLLIVAHLDPTARQGHGTWRGGRAVLRLQLANGQLYGLHVSGDLDAAFRHLEALAAWIIHHPPGAGSSAEYSDALTRVLQQASAGTGRCTVRMPPFSPVMPPPAIGYEMVLKMFLAALNLLRKDFRFEPLGEAPKCIAEYLAERMSTADRAVREFLSSLDQDALALIQHFQNSFHHRYEDLRVYNFFAAGGGTHRLYRMQAIRELPWLLRIVSGMETMHSYDAVEMPDARRTSPQAIKAIVEAIDRALPLFDAVASAFQVPRETVRWTRHRMLPNVRGFHVPRMDLLLAILSWLPPEKRPETDADWRNLRTLITALLPLFTAYWDDSDVHAVLLTHKRYGKILSRWLRELTRPTLREAADLIDRLERDGHGPYEVKDYLNALLRSLRRYCTIPGAAAGREDDTYWNALLSWIETQPLRKIFARSRRWHQEVLRADLPPDTPPLSTRPARDCSWVPVLRAPLRLGQYTVVELCDSASLAAEGRAMQHCVGGYGPACVTGDAAIFSVRDAMGRRLSTAELVIHSHPVHVSVRQHKGLANRPAPVECRETIDTLIAVLNGPPYEKSLQERKDFQRASRHMLFMSEGTARGYASARRLTEERVAWTCTFGAAPEERSVTLQQLLHLGS